MNKYYDIGTRVFAVHKDRLKVKSKVGTKIFVGRIKSYMNYQGTIVPIVTEVGNSKHELHFGCYEFFYDLSKAIKAIK